MLHELCPFLMLWGDDNLKKKEQKNYYVMDECLKKRDMDQFGHKEIADNIINLIKNNKYQAPYNIALIGKWGLGKSSILKMVENDLNSDKDKYDVILINAWKYERESLKKVFLKNIYENVSKTKIDFLQQLESRLRKIFENSPEQTENELNKFGLLKKIIPYLFAFMFISFFWQFFHYISNGGSLSSLLGLLKTKPLFLICRYLNFYFENILVNIGIPILIPFLIDTLNKKSNIFPIQIDYQDDYESMLKKIMRDDENKNKKFIIIIDDLDRLSTKKMVEALDTLKILMEIDKCIFIVPFDDSILKDALNKQVVSKFDNEQQVIESEFILDKLFQFRFYVPPLILSDMKDYTLDILRNESKDLYDMIGEKEIDEIVKKVFMYDGLKTPRQIKKIINTFSNNAILFKERVQNGKIAPDLFNKVGKLMLAKISVLQSDFNDFYDDLFVDSNICEEMIKVNKGEYSSFKDIPKIIQKYFICKDDTIRVKEQYDKLINFLSRTSYIKSQDISIYFLCNQDKMSLAYGSKFSRDLLISMQSMNFSSMNSLIEENNNESIKDLLINYLEAETPYNLPMIIISILNINSIKFNDIEFNQKCINSISNVYDSGEEFDFQYVNLEKLLQLKNNNFDNKILVKFLDEYYKYLNANIEAKELKHRDIYEITIENIDSLSNIDDDEVRKYLYSLCNKDFLYINLLNDIKMDDKCLKRYFGLDLYKYIVELIDDCEDESQYTVYCELLVKLYNALKKDKDENGNINKCIIHLLESEDNIDVCENILTNNINLFNLSEQQQVLEKIVSMSDNELKLQFSIMNCLSFDIDSENEELQNKILSYVENDFDVEKMLNNISDYSFIDDVIQKINENIYSNSRFDNIYSKNIKKFTNEQLESLVDTLASIVNSNTYIEGRITSIINIIDKFVSIDKIINCFATDELIKNKNALNEIVNVINSHDDIEENIINNYIKRVIELLPINKDNILLLEKIGDEISDENLKLLTATIDNGVVESMDLEELQSLFNIYSNKIENEDIIDEIKVGLNALLNTEIDEQVINYMISNNIKITNSIDFIFEHIEKLDKIKKYKNLSEILQIDEDFINMIHENLQNKEYSTEQLIYLCSLNENISNNILNCSSNLNFENMLMLLNVQKVIYQTKGEKELTEFQVSILKSGDNILIENMLDKFISIKNSQNRKLIRNSLEELVHSEGVNDLLLEKINRFCKNQSYRKINSKKKEVVKS